jgi:hypothetical protein
MSDLATRPLSSFKKQKILEDLNKMISDTPYNREFKERVYRSLIGDYTEEDVKRIEKEQEQLLEQIEREMEIKECIQASESKVFLGSVKEISNQYIDGNDET